MIKKEREKNEKLAVIIYILLVGPSNVLLDL